MRLRWYETLQNMSARGIIKHKVWRAHAEMTFYAKSGMDVHGPYPTAQEARKACVAIEEKEG
jgi:hypothetical protein